METKRAFLAIMLSLLILLGYQYLFVPKAPIPQDTGQKQSQDTASQSLPAAAPDSGASPDAKVVQQAISLPENVNSFQVSDASGRQGRDIAVETGLYSAVVSETGGGIKSFQLKKYNNSLDKESDLQQLVGTDTPRELPLFFSWGIEPSRSMLPIFTADQEKIDLSDANVPAEEAQLSMTTKLPSGLEVTRTLQFTEQSYLMELRVTVRNATQQSFQGSPYLSLTNRPFSPTSSSRFLFNGPALYLDGVLQEIKTDDLEKGKKTLSGQIDWVAYEDTYFMCSIIPQEQTQNTVTFSAGGEEKITSLLSASADILPPQGQKEYRYLIFMGPKKLSVLKEIGHNLQRIVDFGWFDALARPALYLLNFFYNFIGNYGIAIILVTVLIKLIFWPISHKGMKSMKTMQKLQPKMTKIREKYKDDKDRLNQEMMKLYQTYKVNPVGGCLPLLLQIPVFFALYKVLLQTIELRHAPFMLWINDLSAPDRLYIGFDIPMLGGLPVLTLLMGASMFFQQKMTPQTAANPEMAKVMKFMPLIFTFMFLNFASGLVLYWFVNNLLSMAQQYVINRQTD